MSQSLSCPPCSWTTPRWPKWFLTTRSASSQPTSLPPWTIVSRYSRTSVSVSRATKSPFPLPFPLLPTTNKKRLAWSVAFALRDTPTVPQTRWASMSMCSPRNSSTVQPPTLPHFTSLATETPPRLMLTPTRKNGRALPCATPTVPATTSSPSSAPPPTRQTMPSKWRSTGLFSRTDSAVLTRPDSDSWPMTSPSSSSDMPRKRPFLLEEVAPPTSSAFPSFCRWDCISLTSSPSASRSTLPSLLSSSTLSVSPPPSTTPSTTWWSPSLSSPRRNGPSSSPSSSNAASSTALASPFLPFPPLHPPHPLELLLPLARRPQRRERQCLRTRPRPSSGS
mmetsp:Transcript_7580/g.12687  ORF Transcript_7580/g.12687 Transcript_7580/m.12687 type:complete len:336 (-) Transcript_7580:342-1349(-)